MNEARNVNSMTIKYNREKSVSSKRKNFIHNIVSIQNILDIFDIIINRVTILMTINFLNRIPSLV